jgi:hypothetical protein
MLLDNVLGCLKSGKVYTIIEIAKVLEEDISIIESAIEHLGRYEYLTKKDIKGCSCTCLSKCSSDCKSTIAKSFFCWMLTPKGENYIDCNIVNNDTGE